MPVPRQIGKREGALLVRAGDQQIDVVAGLEVQQLDYEVRLRHRAAQQRVALALLALRQGKGRVTLQRDLALEQVALARRALPLTAAVDEAVSLAEGGVENGLVLRAFDLLADRFEQHCGHGHGLDPSSRAQPPLLWPFVARPAPPLLCAAANGSCQLPLGRPRALAVLMLGLSIVRSMAAMSSIVQRPSERRWGWPISVRPSSRRKSRSRMTSWSFQPW